MPYDNTIDIQRLLGGTCSFNYEDVACIGDIKQIEYIPIGPGAVNFDLVDIRTVAGKRFLQVEARHILSFLFAEITNRPREMIIEQLVSEPPFGNIWSFRCKD